MNSFSKMTFDDITKTVDRLVAKEEAGERFTEEEIEWCNEYFAAVSGAMRKLAEALSSLARSAEKTLDAQRRRVPVV